MGRSHPVGVVLAALLFGALYQGGAELQFEMPAVSREMIVVIQALVIMFTGALDNMVRMPMEKIFLSIRRSANPAARARRSDRMDFLTVLQILDSSIRLATPLLLACLAGLFSERAGIFDIGLEGKMLAAAFFLGRAFAFTSWLRLGRPFRGGRRVRLSFRPAWRGVDHLPWQPADFRGGDQLPRRRP